MSEEIKRQHPSFGAAVVSIVEGGTGDMFMSGIQHQHRVSLEIHHADMIGSLGYKEAFPKKGIVRVEFSELQWGQLMSRMGQARGTPCTIIRVHGESVEACPPDRSFEDFASYAKQTARKAMSAVAKLVPTVQAFRDSAASKATIGKRELMSFLDELMRDMGSARAHVESNMPFVAEAIQEHAEALVEDAKRLIDRTVEVEAARRNLPPAKVRPRLFENTEDL